MPSVQHLLDFCFLNAAIWLHHMFKLQACYCTLSVYFFNLYRKDDIPISSAVRQCIAKRLEMSKDITTADNHQVQRSVSISLTNKKQSIGGCPAKFPLKFYTNIPFDLYGLQCRIYSQPKNVFQLWHTKRTHWKPYNQIEKEICRNKQRILCNIR